ncbi:tRNA (adenosine(37)-N6)-threonylcarbamoyltransferase complex dimerization subunit type 1 TsaB [Cohnella thailandensis]|uniref:tRNA (Adenosine(37)-N6)-threonylcarbamoyltransferase complex dimerization subunit type 1 TsaB n=1 Tax=Cohnella thailandensis TaxID=557557 RepID=A0A841SS73_9BACL|nr:tRNA (adenosine(37)-N6)-threonylcarbamoyltransferase complex dimerization subunit type 1 TsaB [Cohnella thailandensis]MBB6633446.1 tRNA (adenosine(37)-N6)-threonylcarbamoyltransferase complex dimerization subunit type 1 TsaB [Cohnella thailandensis]MBP1974461.1 tRNA threonylcarbamoyladenosine biosynthesis protein TsaB [Cohnella thailandensis]
MNGLATNGMAEGCTALALDTSTATLAVAVTRNGETVGRSQSYAERNHSVYVTSQMKELLESCGTEASKLDVIAVGQGPGSYTGVRIAVTAAKTLAWIWKKPLVGVSSLEAMAYGFWRKRLESETGIQGDVWIVPLMDARRGQVYNARFVAREDGAWIRAEEDGIRLFKGWFDRLEETSAGTSESEKPPSEIWFLSETGELTAKLLGEADDRIVHGAGPDSAVSASGALCQEVLWEMDAAAVGLLAEERFRRGETDGVHGFVPNYTQLTEAEAKLNAARTESAT